MAVNLSPIWGAGAQLLDNSGNVLTGGKIYTYLAGTTTPATTYTSSNGNTANSNPIILNSAGRVPYEIWLTDSIEYKFVLKDSNDTLIGTWDNLVGINSNFINYYGQQEIQTATAGQTVFTLNDFEYEPGTGNLSVFVDGVNQYGPGAQYAYVETDSNTVTFVSGLHVGASVKFTTTKLENPGVADASQVTYTYPDTNAVTESVESRLAQYVSVKDFGAIGDGVADDTTAIQNAIDSGQKLYFPLGEYLCNVTISEFFEWQGAGMINSVLKPYDDSLPVVTNLYQEPDWRATSISDIGFESTSALTGIGFSYGDPAGYTTGQELIGRVIFNRCSFKGFNKAVLKNYGNIGNVYNQCYFQSNNYGSYAIEASLATSGVSPIMQPDTDTWNGGEFHYNEIAAVCVLANAIPIGQLVFNQTVIQFNPGFGVYMSVPGCGSITPAAFNEVWFEGNATDPTVTIPVVSGGVVTPTALTPKTVSISPSMRAYNFFSGGSGYNGIGTVAPNAPLGIWGDNRTSLNLISDPIAGHWTRIAFANEGTETTVGASISSYLISGTSQNVVVGAGSQTAFAVQPNGSVQIGTPAVTGTTPVDGSHQIYSTVATEGTHILDINGQFQGASAFYVASGGTPNAAATALSIYRNSTTSRSINAGGTVNASGADYAEYMVKCGDFTIEKGDICGVNAEGKLTNVFADAVTFVVKSTDPSYVGGDTWGGKPLGEEPYTEEELEEIRQTVDRIAFAGQVPVNATNATAGDYIVPVLGNDGGIEGVSISNPTFEQYKIAVGKVISVDSNGKPTIIVKVA